MQKRNTKGTIATRDPNQCPKCKTPTMKQTGETQAAPDTPKHPVYMCTICGYKSIR